MRSIFGGVCINFKGDGVVASKEVLHGDEGVFFYIYLKSVLRRTAFV